jgi:O-antigen biosynthesis protein
MTHSEPLVSIIIVTDNSEDITDQCEQSVNNSTPSLSCQIHLAGDNPNLYIQKKWDELKRSEYFVFLRQKTIVQNYWLPQLVELMERDPTTGMAGPKVVTPNGRLYQAGGVIWNNGERLNYGEGDDPNRSKYSYVKEVDFICSACFMIRSQLWNQVGGLNERYASLSWQIVDLAFKVRKAGFKVMYQPASHVEYHHVKTHSVKNPAESRTDQQRLRKEWVHILKREHMDIHQDNFWARDRSRGKKTILVIGLEGPAFDQSTANRMTFHYLKLLLSMGLHVVYSGYFLRLQPYASVLEQTGIQVLYEQDRKQTLEKWIKKNGKYINYAYLIFPFIAERYMSYLKQYTTAKIIYNASDLFYLRERRDYEVTGDTKLLKSSQQWKDREFAIFKKADAIHVVSTFERQMLAEALPGKKIRQIPVYVYDEKEHFEIAPFECRKHLLFVGAFSHKPNIDGVIWFSREIFPKILKKLPKTKLFIIGSNPTPEIKALQSHNILITGYITDNELERYYSECKLVVAPLRFGAGVKGKIVEALFHGIPVVTTSVGAEGMPDIENFISISDEPEDFADKVIRLYNSKNLWNQRSDRSKVYIERYFSLRAARKQLDKDISP